MTCHKAFLYNYYRNQASTCAPANVYTCTYLQYFVPISNTVGENYGAQQKFQFITDTKSAEEYYYYSSGVGNIIFGVEPSLPT